MQYKRIEYNLNVMRQSACLVFNPIMVDNYAAYFNDIIRSVEGGGIPTFLAVDNLLLHTCII